MTPMGNLVIRILLNAVGLWLTALIVPGIHLGDTGEPTGSRLVTILLVAVVFGLVNSLMKPIVTFFSVPFIVLTLGLFLIVVNAAMLGITAWLSGALGLAFSIDHFWWDAVLGAIVLSIISMLLDGLTPARRRV